MVVYCNPAQAMRLVQALTYGAHAGREAGTACAAVTGSFGGKVECLQALYAPYAVDAPRIAIPGMGDRIFSMTQDDELVVALPARFLPALAQGLEEAGRKIGARYPVTFYQNFEPEFPASYKVTAQRLGLFDDDRKLSRRIVCPKKVRKSSGLPGFQKAAFIKTFAGAKKPPPGTQTRRAAYRRRSH